MPLRVWQKIQTMSWTALVADALDTGFVVGGCRLGSVEAGIRYPNRRDLALIELASGSSVAGVFTRNAFCAAPVQVARQHLLEQGVRYLLINSGNANAGTGAAGLQTARASCDAVATQTGVSAQQVLPFSTGVIGEPLPLEPIQRAMPNLVASLRSDSWPEVARAIMTTDTRPKLATRELTIEGRPVRIAGIAKGSGMIHPNMATMLAYVVTDAAVSQDLAHAWNAEFAEQSFNRISVDGDTSTNDACILACTGASKVAVSSSQDAGFEPLREALVSLYTELAHAIVRDGEGATKFVTLQIEGGRTVEECKAVGFAVAHSPLVKTALFASDPNWGRILAAVGNAGLADLDISCVEIDLDEFVLVRNGARHAGYREEMGQTVFRKPEFCVRIGLNRGAAAATIWTTDLSYDYVRINADYRS